MMGFLLCWFVVLLVFRSPEKKLLLFDSPVFLLTDDDPEDARSAISGFCFLALQDDHFSTNTVCCLGFV